MDFIEKITSFINIIYICCLRIFVLDINDGSGNAIEDIEQYNVAYEGMSDSIYCHHLLEDITDFNVLDFYYYPYDGEEVKLYVSASEKVIKEYVEYLSNNAIWQGGLSNRQLNNMSNFSMKDVIINEKLNVSFFY